MPIPDHASAPDIVPIRVGANRSPCATSVVGAARGGDPRHLSGG
jgi:hypothetical protein